jgi:glutamate-1-semialdehyde 2,1-aminomutase
MLNQPKSTELYNEAKQYFPGGVSSPVRAFKSVTGTPLFIRKGDGAQIWDEDDNQFTDFCCSWGPLILGHNNAKVREAIISTVANGTSFGTPTRYENALGKLILENNPYIEMLRFVSSGTEAVMSALRLARGVTGKSKIIKFEGCYHGHVDSLLVKAGSGLVTFGETTSAGVPEAFAKETIVIPLNDHEALLQALQTHAHETACVIIEPIPANNGLLLQEKSFLAVLRHLCTEHGVLLLFDEVISGFRVGFAGAAGYYGIQPDIVTYGKIMGGGMPAGAYGASREIMRNVSPEGAVYQAGTLSGNPVAMSAGAAALSQLVDSQVYADLAEKTANFVGKIQSHADQKNYPMTIPHIGSIFWLAFSRQTIRAAHEIDANSMQYFKALHKLLLERGIYLGPSGYEVGFVSTAHTVAELDAAAQIMCDCLDIVFAG